MKKILLNILTILTLSTFGQQKVWTGDTTYWYKYQKYVNSKLGLEDLSNSKYLFAFRITSLNIITDIWTVDGTNFNGKQILFTSTSDENPEKIEYFHRTERIGNDTAQIINQFLEDYKILNIPQQDSIRDWGNGLDGSIYLIEFATPALYSFKSYWTPTAFPSIPEAVSISNFVQKIADLLKQQEKFDNLIESLPKDKSYRYGNAWTKIWINSKPGERK
jgi:hypothetical protein